MRHFFNQVTEDCYVTAVIVQRAASTVLNVVILIERLWKDERCKNQPQVLHRMMTPVVTARLQCDTFKAYAVCKADLEPQTKYHHRATESLSLQRR